MTTALSAPDPCPHCGGDGVELLEGWSLLTAEFMVDACCERAQDDFLSEWDSPDALNALGLGDLLGSPVRAVHHDGLQSVIDARLSLGPINQREARVFIARHHRHCPPPPGWLYGFGAFNADRLVGVAWVGRPVARLIDASTTVEVNRLCTLDSPLSRQAASMLLASAAREARRRGYRRIITYTLLEEKGSSLRGAGWVLDGTTRGGSRSRPGRNRSEHATGKKCRWSKALS